MAEIKWEGKWVAPDAPYDDEEMKEVFQLFLSAFENLDDKSGPSYFKRTSILETVAKVRSCVVMLDLECDELIAKMFQHFFKSIRMEWKNQKKNPARGRRKGEVGRGKLHSTMM